MARRYQESPTDEAYPEESKPSAVDDILYGKAKKSPAVPTAEPPIVSAQSLKQERYKRHVMGQMSTKARDSMDVKANDNAFSSSHPVNPHIMPKNFNIEVPEDGTNSPQPLMKYVPEKPAAQLPLVPVPPPKVFFAENVTPE